MDADEQRAQMLERWDRSAPNWGKHAGDLRAFGMPVSSWLIERLEPHPGQRLLELAAGPGDTGFLAAERLLPDGTLISSDGSGQMLGVARQRASELGIENVEFAQLDLEWIDLPTASVDAVICRWGMMLVLDPQAALHETRRVLRPGGRIALAVWAAPEHNPWATVPTRALVAAGRVEPPDPSAPGMFALADPGRLRELLEGAGFGEVEIEELALVQPHSSAEHFVAHTAEMSLQFGDAYSRMAPAQRRELVAAISSLAAPFTGADGSIEFPALSLAATAVA